MACLTYLFVILWLWLGVGPRLPETVARQRPQYVEAGGAQPGGSESPPRPRPSGGALAGGVLAAALVLGGMVAAGFDAIDSPRPDGSAAAVAFVAAGVVGVLTLACCAWLCRPPGWIAAGVVPGLALAVWLVEVATRYTSGRTCQTHRSWFSETTTCTADPGGGMALALSVFVVAAVAATVIAIAGAARAKEGVRRGALVVGTGIGAAYGAAGLILAVRLPSEVEVAAASNRVEHTVTTAAPEAILVVLFVVFAAAFLRRRGDR